MKSKFIASGLAALAILTGCGSKGFNPDGAIAVVTREDGSGTKSAFMEILGLKGQADPNGAIVATGTASVLAEVAGNPQAIAFDSLGYVTDKVKLVKVDGVEATVENIQNGSYTISRPLSIVYQEATVTANPLLTAFKNFLGSSNANSIISEEGYVTVSEGSAYTADSSISGSIAISGSTSLQPLMILLADEFESLQANVTVEVSGGGSGTGYSNAENGVSQFGMISEEFTQSKAPNCVSSTVALDGIGIIVNLENTIENISKADLKNIYDVNSETPFASWSDVLA